MSDTLGARLRRQREQRQITLATIAEQTKIKVSLLEHLERDDVSQWPAGIFRRAFVRSYAKAIGLDPEVVVREFVALHPDPDDVAAAPADGASIDGGAPGGSPPTRLRSLVGSAIGSLGRRRSAGGDAQRPADRQAGVAPPSGPEPAKAAAVEERIAPQPDFLAAANVCIELGQVSELSDAAPGGLGSGLATPSACAGNVSRSAGVSRGSGPNGLASGSLSMGTPCAVIAPFKPQSTYRTNELFVIVISDISIL